MILRIVELFTTSLLRSIKTTECLSPTNINRMGSFVTLAKWSFRPSQAPVNFGVIALFSMTKSTVNWKARQKRWSKSSKMILLPPCWKSRALIVFKIALMCLELTSIGVAPTGAPSGVFLTLRNWNSRKMERVCSIITCQVFLWNLCNVYSANGCLAKRIIFLVDNRTFRAQNFFGFEVFVVILCSFLQHGLFDWEEAFTTKLQHVNW